MYLRSKYQTKSVVVVRIFRIFVDKKGLLFLVCKEFSLHFVLSIRNCSRLFPNEIA